MFASHYKLYNLVFIVDRNKQIILGKNEKLLKLEPLAKKWESFGWYTEKCNGHDVEDLISKFENFKKVSKPKVLICETIKGKGFKFSENKNEWHHSIMTQKIYDEALKELNEE